MMGEFFSYLFTRNDSDALHDAVKRADLKAIRQLVKQGYAIDSLDKSGVTPLQLAIGSKFLDFPNSHGSSCITNIKGYQKQGTDNSAVSLFNNFLVQYGMLAMDKMSAFFPLSDGNTSLQNGKKKRNISHLESSFEIVKTLLDLGASLNLCRVGKVKLKPPLFHAIDACRPDLVRILVTNGADARLLYQGQNTLEYTLIKPKPDHMKQKTFFKIKKQILMLLLERCNLGGANEDYALCQAVWTGNPKAVTAELDKSSVDDIDTPTRSRGLALCAAIANGQPDIVCLLVDRGVDLRDVAKYPINPVRLLMRNKTVDEGDRLWILIYTGKSKCKKTYKMCLF